MMQPRERADPLMAAKLLVVIGTPASDAWLDGTPVAGTATAPVTGFVAKQLGRRRGTLLQGFPGRPVARTDDYPSAGRL
jgi:hypothetical protein